MGVKTFAAIDVGSYELSMKIFEISPKEKLREIDHIRHRIDLGTETYTTGKLSHEKVDELCRVLSEYSDIMKSYRVADYQAYGTSAVREMVNREIVLEQIKMRTGIHIDILSNSEQRFLDYKSVASKGESFNWLISNGTAMLDIGGGSLQVSLFDKDSLVTTQNMRLGILLIREHLSKLKLRRSQYADIIDELSGSQIEVLEKLYLKGKKIDNMIVVDEYISNALGKKDRRFLENYIDKDTYLRFMEEVREHSWSELSKELQMPEESIVLLYISSMLVEKFLRTMGVSKLWIPGVTLCDGIGYEYAEKNKILVTTHDFEKDIIDCTQNISKRYMGSKKRGETLEKIALTIFDSMKKAHGLSKRERLLLRLAALLHEIGKTQVSKEMLFGREDIEENRERLYQIQLQGLDIVEEAFPEGKTLKRICMPALRAQYDFSVYGKVDPDLKLSNVAKILLVANRYDELTAMDLQGKSESEVKAIWEFRDHPELYDEKVVEALLKSVNILIPGVSVELDNRDKALVLVENNADVLRPMLLSFKDNSILDLSLKRNKDIRIMDIMKTLDNRYVMDMETVKEEMRLAKLREQ